LSFFVNVIYIGFHHFPLTASLTLHCSALCQSDVIRTVFVTKNVSIHISGRPRSSGSFRTEIRALVVDWLPEFALSSSIIGLHLGCWSTGKYLCRILDITPESHNTKMKGSRAKDPRSRTETR
jgi:hypothetical protein